MSKSVLTDEPLCLNSKSFFTEPLQVVCTKYGPTEFQLCRIIKSGRNKWSLSRLKNWSQNLSWLFQMIKNGLTELQLCQNIKNDQNELSLSKLKKECTFSLETCWRTFVLKMKTFWKQCISKFICSQNISVIIFFNFTSFRLTCSNIIIVTIYIHLWMDNIHIKSD